MRYTKNEKKGDFLARKRTIKDIDLWWQVAQTVDPLRPQKNVIEEAGEPQFSKMLKPSSHLKTPLPVKTHPPAGFDQALMRRVKRGKDRPERTLDLHGHRLDTAHRALLSFLKNAQISDHRLVLVITGKGRTGSPEGEKGALRRAVPLWMSALEFRAIVHSFSAAPPRLGGEGALLIKVKKAHSKR